MEFPRRVFDGEGVKADVDFGPTLMLNRNRCILCTRCVRFMREVDGDAQINIVDRGYGSEIATFQEEGVHSLLSGNLMDVCPVGAITTRDYRFKSRPWDNPDAVDTICTLCAKGCNTTAWLKAKPEWAKGVAADPHHAALQPRRQRLLDVRHRPLRLPLDRRRRAPAAAAGARAAGTLEPVDWHERWCEDRRSRRTRPADPAACASWSRRTRRSKSCSFIGRIGGALGLARGRRRGQLATRARSRSRRTRSSRFRPSTRRTSPARAISGFPVRRTAAGDAGSRRRSAQKSKRGRVQRALRLRSRARTARSATSSWIIEAQASGQAAAADRPGRADDASSRRPPISCCRARRGSRRTRLRRTTRDGCRAPRARFAPPGEAHGRLADPRRTSALALGRRRSTTSSAATCARDIAARCRATERTPGSTSWRSRGRCSARHWLQASNPSERWKWDFMFQDLPPVKFDGLRRVLMRHRA